MILLTSKYLYIIISTSPLEVSRQHGRPRFEIHKEQLIYREVNVEFLMKPIQPFMTAGVN